MSRWERRFDEIVDLLGVAQNISDIDAGHASSVGGSAITLGAALLASFCCMIVISGFSDALKPEEADPAENRAWKAYYRGKELLKPAIIKPIRYFIFAFFLPGIWIGFIAHHFGPGVALRPTIGVVPAIIFVVLAMVASTMIWGIMVHRTAGDDNTSEYATRMKDSAVVRLDARLAKWPAALRVVTGLFMLSGLALLTLMIIVSALYDYLR